MKTLGIVPARGGSKRISGKNLRRIGGRTLVSRAIEAALNATSLDRTIVSSDDTEILNIASTYGSVVPLRRPAELSTDRSPALDFVRHALATIDPLGDPFEAVVIVQPSSPFTLGEDIDQTVALLDRPDTDSAVTVVKLDHAVHPLKMKRLEGDSLVAFLEEEGGRMAAHELPDIYVRNGSVYASRRAVIDRGSILGPRCRALVMSAERSVDINTALDLQFAEFLAARRDAESI